MMVVGGAMIADRDGQTVRAWTSGVRSSLSEQLGPTNPNNLRLPLSTFVGRDEAKATVRQLLADTRLLTLTGPGGVGKTRLALEVAFAVVDEVPGGVWWVDLAPVADAGLVAHTVALTLRLPDDPTRSKVDLLRDHMREQALVLVLDNCEHVIAGCATVVAQLLSHCPRLRVLATSREPLDVAGETVWSVPPLSLPCLDEVPTPETVAQSEAGQLFLDRALASRPGLVVTDAVARAMAEVCCRLDGIPLAIELAAARVRALSVPQIAARLDNLFGLLTGERRTSLPRQQTLQATMDWSYNLLTWPERKLFCHLAVFFGFGLEAAEMVTSGPHGPEAIAAADVLDLLTQLVDKSLVVVQAGETVRYRMLETIRQYAWERLSASAELDAARQRHLAYYLELAERAESRLGCGEQVTWLRLLEIEHDNLRAALTLSQEGGHAQLGLRLASALAPFWLRVGHLSEGRDWLERALAACREIGPARIKALYQSGWLAHRRGDYEAALRCARQSLALSRRLGDTRGMARALGLMGWVTHAQGDRDAAGPLLEQGLALARDSADERTIARALLFLGDLWLRTGKIEQAATLLAESQQRYQEMGDAWSMAWALNSLGELARRQGDNERAVARLELSLVLYQEVDGKSEIANPLESLALLAAEQGRFDHAARLWGAASAVRSGVRALLQPSYVADYAPSLAQVRAALGKDAFVAAWTDGQAMTLVEAVHLATQSTVPARAAATSPPFSAPAFRAERSLHPNRQASDYGLTRRETEVLLLLSDGLTDAQIADRLVISPRTVGKHVQSIYGKLHLSSRSAATRWAIEHLPA